MPVLFPLSSTDPSVKKKSKLHKAPQADTNKLSGSAACQN